jgi:hypothetical protein
MLQPDEFAVQVIDYCPTLEGDELLVVCEVAEQVSLLAREHAFGCASQRNSKIVVTGIQRSYRSFDLPVAACVLVRRSLGSRARIVPIGGYAANPMTQPIARTTL